ncbi:195_t:CDS:10 [Funneliformis mosseae]|uniref:Mediator of RNA polymerase II transcription subunit 1 n=1 Tax=Funneliformis mosseae TaxID=27381 RepID=A0A9N9D1N4_FUNMO|nr:195_t:CDS:10 [Funneliformis mosseae]
MTETDSKSIHSLVRDLQSLVKNAQEQWKINFPRQGQADQPQTNIAVPNVVHPLGPVNLSELPTEISQKIAVMRDIITKFKNNTLSGVPQLQHGTESLLKNHINQLKEETERLESLSEVRDNIKICKSLALDACQDNATAFKFIIKQTESFGKQLGLQIIYDIEKHGIDSTLSMSGSIIVLDKNLETLATLDMISKSNTPVDCFLCIKCISNDLKAIYEKESDITIGDIPKILTEGHGIPLFHFERVGPSIAYWAPKYRIIEIDWNIVKDIINQGGTHGSFRYLNRMWITMEKSRDNRVFLPSDRSQYLLDITNEEIDLNYIMQNPFSLFPNGTQLKFLDPTKVASAPVAPIEFVAWLDPPVYVSDNVARAIGNLAGVAVRGFFISSAFQKKDPQALSLEQLLIEGIIPPVNQSSSAQASKIVHQWEKIFSSDNMCNTNARRIDRIPFSHPSQLPGFIKTLRQQLIFNTLYQSCFNSSTYKQITITKKSKYDHDLKENSLDIEAKVHVKVQTDNPPNGLTLSIQLPQKMAKSQTTIHLHITILLPYSQIYVVSHITGFGDISIYNLNDENLSRVLSMCQDIPMTINWILKNLSKPEEKMMIDEVEVSDFDNGFKRGFTKNASKINNSF